MNLDSTLDQTGPGLDLNNFKHNLKLTTNDIILDWKLSQTTTDTDFNARINFDQYLSSKIDNGKITFMIYKTKCS